MCLNVSAFIETLQTEWNTAAANLKRNKPKVTSPRKADFLL